MQQQGLAVYNTTKDAVISLSAMDKSGKEVKVFSGWIQDVVRGRIFVLTCAHNLLANSITLPAYTSFAGTIENARGKKGKSNIGVSMKILGFDISADIAVLYSILPCEESKLNPLGFKFSDSQSKTTWARSPIIEDGTAVYSISNVYDSGLVMTTGFMEDDIVIYNTQSLTYTNFTEQLISSLSVSDGSSGSPVFIYDSKLKMGVVVGMVAFTKNIDNFTGGPNLNTLQGSYNKLIELNTVNYKVNDLSVNFTGKTGKGYIGVTSYDMVDDFVLVALARKFPKFNASKYRNSANGVIIGTVNTKNSTIPNSRVQNAVSKECSKKGIQSLDIVLEVEGKAVGVYDNSAAFNSAEYFKAGQTIKVKVLRPETAEILYFKVLCDEYPANLEHVSTDDTIRLVGFFSTLGAKVGGWLGGLIDNKLGT